jgi:hypothetical protein
METILSVSRQLDVCRLGSEEAAYDAMTKSGGDASSSLTRWRMSSGF